MSQRHDLADPSGWSRHAGGDQNYLLWETKLVSLTQHCVRVCARVCLGCAMHATVFVKDVPSCPSMENYVDRFLFHHHRVALIVTRVSAQLSIQLLFCLLLPSGVT
mmetsp:Transcript_52435/g.93610  ORF Transcript_52435/g.93610 Transcript_52435/m.93610 type:complete len:106 (-) Transcript_52435:35-352(-)